jgi:hypothetical protein
MRKIGYARVSTSTQNLDRQIGALRAERCHEVYREKASGKAIKGRPQLGKAIDALGTGDVVVVAEWDRATRSMMDGVHIIERIHARGAMIKVLDKPHLEVPAHRPRLHRFPERPGGGRAPSDLEACQRWSSCCPEARRAHGLQAQAERAATARGSRAGRQGRERQSYRPGVGRGSHHRGTGRRIGGLLTGHWPAEAARP